MLTILDRQLIYSFIKAYLFCLVSLMGLFVIVDLFMNLEELSSHHRELDKTVQFIGVYYANKSLQIFNSLCESVILIAAMFTVAWMQRNNELLPLLSAGVSTRRAVQPVLLCAFVLMGLAVVNQELGLPRIDLFMLENRQNPDGAKETIDLKPTYDANGILVSAKTAIRKDQLVKSFTATIPAAIGRNGVMVFLHAKEAEYIPLKEEDKRSGGWLLTQTKTTPELVNWSREDILMPLGDGVFFLKTPGVNMDSLIRVKNWFRYLPTWELLKELDRPGNNQHNSLAVVFHARLTRPVIGIILVLLGLSVILHDQNRNVFVSAGLCLTLAVIFFATIAGCQYLGTSTIVSPALSAWLPVILFGPFSLVMYDAVHT